MGFFLVIKSKFLVRLITDQIILKMSNKACANKDGVINPQTIDLEVTVSVSDLKA